MKRCGAVLFASGILLAVVSVQVKSMEPLDDQILAKISGAEGVQLTLGLRKNVDSSGNPMGCSGILNPCRMGIEFSGREGIWLMLKDYYGMLGINDIRLEGAQLPTSNTGYQDGSRFIGGDGNCLIADCDPRSLQAVKVTYPFNKGVGDYFDFTLLMNIGRTALEFDDSGSGTPGYMRDVAAGSVLGFRMADSSVLNAPSRSRFDGTAYVFGF